MRFALIGSLQPLRRRLPCPQSPAPQSLPKPAADTGGPTAPQAILPGGIVVPLFAPNSPYLKADKIHVPEVYNLSRTVHGRINSIVRIHNPSIEVHMVDKSINTGTAVIVIAGGGHRTLNVAVKAPTSSRSSIITASTPSFFESGCADGYVAEVDAVHDAHRPFASSGICQGMGNRPEWIGVMGFSAGAELAAPAAVLYDDWDKKNSDSSDPFSGISSRPDFVGIIYPGPTPFARNRTAPPIPKDVPPAFLVCGSAGDRVHTVWALEYYQAMLSAGVPNVELHLYGNGRHPGDPLPDGGRMSGGLTDRNNIPYGTWQFRFIDWASRPRLPPEARHRNQGREGCRQLRSQPAPSVWTGTRRRGRGRAGQPPASGAPGAARNGACPAHAAVILCVDATRRRESQLPSRRRCRAFSLWLPRAESVSWVDYALMRAGLI